MYGELADAAAKGMLILIDGGLCHFVHKKDGTLVIHNIISQKPGAGQVMLSQLLKRNNVACIMAKCPIDLPSNEWYRKRGFELSEVLETRTQRKLNVWRMWCKPEARYATPSLFDPPA